MSENLEKINTLKKTSNRCLKINFPLCNSNGEFLDRFESIWNCVGRRIAAMRLIIDGRLCTESAILIEIPDLIKQRLVVTRFNCDSHHCSIEVLFETLNNGANVNSKVAQVKNLIPLRFYSLGKQIFSRIIIFYNIEQEFEN